MLRKLLDRPIAVTTVVVVLVILGIVASRLLPVSLVPDVDAPYITIQIPAPGLSARQLDETVIAPLRQQLIQLSHLTDLRSEARESSGTIHLSFEQGSDIDYLFIEVNEKIDRAVAALPRDLDRPRVIKASATDIPAFYINLTVRDRQAVTAPDELHPVSDAFSALSRFAAQVITKRIEQLPEVAMVDLSGTVAPELLVIPDEAKLRQAGIAMADIEQALKRANVTLGSLTVRDGEYRYNVKFRSAVSSRDDIENIYLKIHGRLFRLRELAEVVEHPRKRQGMVLSDGRDAISLAVVKQSDARMATLKQKLDKLLREFRRDYPDVEFTVTRDQTELLDYSISNLVRNIVAGALLACVIIFLFMRDLKSPLLVVLTIPVTLIVSVLVFYMLHISINIISLSGLVLGIGMMVDNSIILVDNITAHWMRGEQLVRAITRGTREVMMPMLSSVLTTCAVFIPLIFINGMAGALFYDQAMAVSITLFVSYGVSVTLLPVYYRWLYGRQEGFEPAPWLERFSFERLLGGYDRLLAGLFRRRWAMWSLYAVSVAGAIVLFRVLDKERLPKMSYNDMLVRIDWNDRISAEENARRTEALVASLGEGVVQSTVMAGIQQFILPHADDNGIAEATVYLKCRDAADVAPIQEAVRNRLAAQAPAAGCSFGVSGNIFDMIFAEREAVLTARLRAATGRTVDPESLQRLVERLRAALPGVEIPPVALQEDILYVARPEQLVLYGVTYGDLIAALRNALNENTLFTITSGNESLPVVMGSNRRSLDELFENTFIRTSETEIPVSVLMRQTLDRDLKTVVAGAEGNYYPLELTPRAKEVPAIVAAIRRCVAEDGRFEVSFSGSYYANRGMVRQLVGVLVVALLLLFFILAAQFESLVQPWIILSEIIIDLCGALAVLWCFDQTLNLMSMIGLIVVCGIVINDSILKIDTINRLRHQGMELKHAVMEAGRRRLKAIVMTSLTTILAVAPFLVRGDMGSDLQFPMSLVIISGMIVGTLVSLFFIPLAYYEIYRNRR